MRTIGVVTTSRADYGIYRPVLRPIQTDPALQLELYVTGMHLVPEFGMTVREIQADGFKITERLEMMLASDTPEGISKSVGLGVMSFSQLFARRRPDILMVLGDRFETVTAPLAALPFKIPVAHLHGGEVTQGAIDESLRHAITKLSHLHFVSTEVYARRVIQMGEAPWRVTVSGAPGLDNLKQITLLTPEQLQEKFGLEIDPANPPLLITFHPVTLEYEQAEWQINELLAALEQVGQPLIFTLPNADPGGRSIARHIQEFVAAHANVQQVDSLGTRGYFSLMALAGAMVGNSSSGIIEAASFKLPVVNIGTRQQGRVQSANVINADYPRQAILQAVQQALSAGFRQSLAELVNPYGDGHAAERIVDRLKTVPLDDGLLVKVFHDL